MNTLTPSNTKPLCWFESGESLEWITKHLQKTHHTIRIATAFFTIKGWNLIRRYTTDKKTYILVGLEDPGEQRAKIALVQEIMKELRSGLDRDRRKAVLELVNKIESNEFGIVDARSTDHHNKLFIFDTKIAIQSSSNLTFKGLTQQVEGGLVTDQIAEIEYLVEQFDRYFADAHDLTEDLLDVLRRWLQLATPWDIYLKTMLAFENIQSPKTRYDKKPVSYQIDMIAQTLRQIRAFDGSMIVASTGLGKTVIAVHVAIHLKEEDLIDNVMIIGPKTVSRNWDTEMMKAGLHCKYFVRQTFDRTTSQRDHNLKTFEQILQDCEQQRWMLIIDECHEFRNRFQQNLFNLIKNPPERRAFTRLREFIKKGGLKVLNLTGSPYGTDIDNLNHQLCLLPHKAERRQYPFDWFTENCPDHQHLFEAETKDANAWYVKDIDQFIQVPVVSQLTTPHVAKYYGQQDKQGTYIQFTNEKRYVPDVTLHTVTFPLIFESELTEIIAKGYFEVATKNARFKKNAMFKDIFNRLVKLAWASSPLALKDILQSIADTPEGENSYNLEKICFCIPREDREKVLKPILEKLEKSNYEDAKFSGLLEVLFRVFDRKVEEQKKVIIFCERRPTVVYLYKKLKHFFSKLKIAATIQPSEDDQKYKLKNSYEIEEMIKKFAPQSNDNIIGDNLEEYNIFLSTDAQGVGVNMQDASIVINYDIAWTPINPVQRAGRILRFWYTHRMIEVYTFIPKSVGYFGKFTGIQQDLIDIEKRWQTLVSRHEKSSKIIELPVLTTAETEELNVTALTSEVTIKSGELDLDALADLEISPYYEHTAKLQINREYAKTLSDDLISGKSYSGQQHLLYLLIRYNNNYYGMFYNPRTKDLTEPDVVEVLRKISCDQDTPTAPIDYDEVDNLNNDCIKCWCEKHKVTPDELENVERICSLYLIPENEDDFTKLF
ncbi:helicase-related protein [Roseofilum sp. Guam]|uniref:helicase-related protein n=1 Tax=Roseofilum sp. Guam TaxID=2821502 RepID=UPI001B036262|nr:helicase-related protein [Roseofilum sp. Guam]MBP0028643.1 DEAD/DEAH box helicase family protein [Roseofilum sp. Guam]